jgi:hypothetical protein
VTSRGASDRRVPPRGGPGELVPLDAGSRTIVEAFLGRELGERVDLGAVHLAAGATGAAVAAVARASAITLGGIICLDRARGARVRAMPDRALEALGSLLVHECVHVWQYRAAGAPRFLAAYLKNYFTTLLVLRSLRANARVRAYRTIDAELQAFELEARWRQEYDPTPLL